MINILNGTIIVVAPRAGAWIETLLNLQNLYSIEVAPRAGAWIETVITPVVPTWVTSRSPRGSVD